MYKIISCFILLLLLFKTSGASFDRNRVSKYYCAINQAELAIVDSQLEIADSLYKYAFMQKFPTAKDVYNAFIVAYMLRDTVQAKFCFSYILGHGVRKEGFEKMSFVDSIKDEMFYIRDVAWDDERYFWESYLSLQRSKACFLDSLFAVDQFYRKYPKEAAKLGYNFDRVNVEAFLNKVQEWHSFPSSDQVGLSFVDVEGINEESAIFFLHWHTRFEELKKDTTIIKLDSVLNEAVLDGQYDPLLYAITVDQRGQNHGVILPDSILRGAISNEMNKKRAAIYLESAEDFLKKLRYFLTKRDQPFLLISKWWALADQATFVKIKEEIEKGRVNDGG